MFVHCPRKEYLEELSHKSPLTVCGTNKCSVVMTIAQLV